jgi:hypothetical protein
VHLESTRAAFDRARQVERQRSRGVARYEDPARGGGRLDFRGKKTGASRRAAARLHRSDFREREPAVLEGAREKRVDRERPDAH